MMRFRKDDRGAALITVMILGFVMMILIATGLTVATSGLRQAVGVQRSTSALDAAFAGVQDYLARINVDESYIKYGNPANSSTAYGNPADPFSSPSNLAAPDPWNPAFGTGASTGVAATDAAQHRTWATVPGSGGTAKFRYEVSTTTYATNGIVKLRVTGLAGQRTRTLLANLRVKGFVDYVYFTDYELSDPEISGSPASCTKYKWQGRSTSCSKYEIRFSPNDVIYGDVHSNDTIIICGTTFTGTVETANTGTPLYTTPSGCTNRSINAKRVDTLPMPSSNTGMRADAACVYTGPTQITYNDDGTMTVVSPWTKYTSIGAAPSNPLKCGTLAGLHSATGATVAQLDKDLLYVQNVPATPTTDPNYWSTTDKPASLSCIATDNSTTSAANGIGWSLTTGGKTVRYPSLLEAPSDGWENSSNPLLWDTTTPAYGCRNGDLYVSGKVTTLTTAASANYVYVTDDITYKSKTTDILGLVGTHAVLVYNPMKINLDIPLLPDFNREIDAAILSVDNTFQVQNYFHGGTRGQLTVFGSIAQKFRGPVGSVDPDTGLQLTGYTKAYQYDPVLKTISPPKFLAPSSTSFSVTQYAAVPSAFTPAGVLR